MEKKVKKTAVTRETRCRKLDKHGDEPQKLPSKKKNELQWRQNKKSDGTPLKDMRKMKKLKRTGT